MHALIAVCLIFPGWYSRNSKIRDKWWKKGLLAAQKQKGAPAELLAVFWCFLTNEGDGFPPPFYWDGVSSDQTGQETKVQVWTERLPCCPVSVLMQIGCTSWSKLPPRRSSTALWQPLEKLNHGVIPKINLRVLCCATELRVCVFYEREWRCMHVTHHRSV